MLDKRTGEILDYLIKNCSGESSVVVDKEEIVKELFNGEDDSDVILKDGLSYLERGNYLKVKYFDDSRFFIVLTALGRTYFEEQRSKRMTELKLRRSIFILVYIAAVLGGITGCIVSEFVLRILGV